MLRALLLRTVVLVVVCVSPSLRAAEEERVEELAELLLQNPLFESVMLSPDGSHLAMFLYRNGVRTLGTYDLQRKQLRIAKVDRGESVYRFGWLDEDRVIFAVDYWGIYHARLMLIDESMRRKVEHLDANRGSQLLMFVDGLPWIRRQAIAIDVQAKPYRTFFRYEYPRGFRTMSSNREMLHDYAFDRAGNWRVKTIGRGEANAYDAFHRKDDGAQWEPIDLPEIARLYDFAPDSDILYATHRHGSPRAVFQGYDLSQQAYVGGAITDPHYAVFPSLMRTQDTGEMVGLFYEADRPVVLYTDPAVGQVAQMLKRALPDQFHVYLGVRQEGGLLFYSWSDRQPGIVHELDLENRALKRVLETRPKIDASAMAAKHPFAFPARDGVTVRGYYTLPPGVEPDKAAGLPLVVIVHGGPRARDDFSFDSEVQFFAHLGYAVLQVNYRGSSTLYEDLDITFLDTCRYAVDDVVDGARWMVAEGLVDPERMAIYGWSFGGYAAVAAAARYPDLFQCAYAAAGVYDFVSIFEDEFKDIGAYLEWDAGFYGDIEGDRERYLAVSPVHHAEKIEVPVFLLHGGADGVVGIEQSRAMHRALRVAGKDVQLETPSWLRHGPGSEKERLKFTQAVYRFISAHID